MVVQWLYSVQPSTKIYYKKIMDSTKNPVVISDSMELIQDDNQNMSPRKKEKKVLQSFFPMRLFIKCNTVLGVQIIYIIENRFPSRHKLRFCNFADAFWVTVSVSYTTISIVKHLLYVYVFMEICHQRIGPYISSVIRCTKKSLFSVKTKTKKILTFSERKL